MKINYCLPIIKNKTDEVLEIVQKKIDEYQYFEIWLDYIDDLDDAFVKKLQVDLDDKLILVFRRKNFEKEKISSKRRLNIISQLDKSDCYLDLDISNQKTELNYVIKQKLNIKTIISYHNYQQTPSENELKEIVEKIQVLNPTILKISTFCKNQKDAIRLLNLLTKLKEKNTRCIVLGMGEFGIITRVQGILLGNEMIFAPVDKNESSAPGQLTKRELESIYNKLN